MDAHVDFVRDLLAKTPVLGLLLRNLFRFSCCDAISTGNDGVESKQCMGVAGKQQVDIQMRQQEQTERFKALNFGDKVLA